jgi:protein TonB
MAALASNSGVRLAVAAPIAAAVTVGLFLLMSRLIHVEQVTLERSNFGSLSDFLAKDVDDTVRTQKRVKPRAIETADQPPPPPRLTANKSDVNLPTPRIEGAAPTNVAPSRIEAVSLGSVAVSDRDAQPVRRVPANYPDRMAERGIEGRCEVRFNVDRAGRPKDVVPSCFDKDGNAQPGFNDAVVRAVQQQEYAPKIVNGQPVERSNVVQPFTFNLSR